MFRRGEAGREQALAGTAGEHGVNPDSPKSIVHEQDREARRRREELRGARADARGDAADSLERTRVREELSEMGGASSRHRRLEMEGAAMNADEYEEEMGRLRRDMKGLLQQIDSLGFFNRRRRRELEAEYRFMEEKHRVARANWKRSLEEEEGASQAMRSARRTERRIEDRRRSAA